MATKAPPDAPRKSRPRKPAKAKTDLDQLKAVKVGVETLAEVLGLTTRRIQQLKAEGVLPGARGKYPLVACANAYVTYLQRLTDGRAPTDAAGEQRSGWQTRKLAAEAEAKELEVARLREILVSREYMREQLEGCFQALRPQLLAFSGAWAGPVSSCSSAAEVKVMLDEGIEQLMATLSQLGDDPVIDAEQPGTAA